MKIGCLFYLYKSIDKVLKICYKYSRKKKEQRRVEMKLKEYIAELEEKQGEILLQKLKYESSIDDEIKSIIERAEKLKTKKSVFLSLSIQSCRYVSRIYDKMEDLGKEYIAITEQIEKLKELEDLKDLGEKV